MGCLSDVNLPQFQIPCANTNVDNNNPNQNQPAKILSISTFQPLNIIKDGLYVYIHTNSKGDKYFLADFVYCPLCNQIIEPNEVQKMNALKLPNSFVAIEKYRKLVYSNKLDILDELEKLADQIEKDIKYMEDLHYKYICPYTNTAIYLKLYDNIVYNLAFEPQYEIYESKYWKNNPTVRKELLRIREKNLEKRKKKEEEEKRRKEAANYGDDDDYTVCNCCSTGKVSSSGYCNGKALWGKVKVVNSFADFKVAVVSSFPDLKVQKVSSFS